jgi:hypothetical protein
MPKNTAPKKLTYAQRRTRLYRTIIIVVSVILILSWIMSLVVK